MAPPPRPPVICYDLHSNMPTRRRHLSSLPTFARTSNTRPASAVRIKSAPPIPPEYIQPPRVHTRHISSTKTVKITPPPPPPPLSPKRRQPSTRSRILTPTNYMTNHNIVSCSTPRGNRLDKPPRSSKRAGHHVTINTTPCKSPCKTPIPRAATRTPRQPSSSFFCTAPLDNDTLEVTDIRFFETVEDKTMMDLDGMIARLPNLQSLKDL